MVFKKNLTPLSKKGQIVKHAGKGSDQAPLPARGALNKLARNPNAGVNDYSKASPASQPAGDDSAGFPGLGSGDWAGNGM